MHKSIGLYLVFVYLFDGV